LDCGVRGGASASGEPTDAYVWDTDYYFVRTGGDRGDLLALVTLGGAGSVFVWVGAAVYWARGGGQTAGVFQGLEILVGGIAVVGGENARQSLRKLRKRFIFSGAFFPASTSGGASGSNQRYASIHSLKLRVSPFSDGGKHRVERSFS
jgi:hypothetical protein